jgi:hypothetical protein
LAKVWVAHGPGFAASSFQALKFGKWCRVSIIWPSHF